MFLAVFANGSIGTFESTRYARGRKNYSSMELNGENGAVFFNLEDAHMLKFFRYADPETGNSNIRQTLWLVMYGRTVSGKAVATEPVRVAFNFFCVTP